MTFVKIVGADTVEGDQAYLVENIEVVQMALVKDQLQQQSGAFNVDRLKLSSLEPTSLI